MKTRRLLSIGVAGLVTLAWVANVGATIDDDPMYDLEALLDDTPGVGADSEVGGGPTVRGTYEWDQLWASDWGENDYFGYSVGTFGTYFIVGAPYWDDGAKQQTGIAYIYYYNPGTGLWDEEKLYDSSTQEPGDLCGKSVSIYGGYAIVGCPYADKPSGGGTISNAGRMYIYELRSSTTNTWDLNNYFHSPNAEVNGYYGWSVSVSKEWAIVGAPYEHNVGAPDNTGRAYIYKERLGSWGYNRTLERPGTLSANEFFGYSVGVSPTDSADVWVIAGSPGHKTYAGAAWVWKRGAMGWDYEDSLWASDHADYDWFGFSVSISADNGAVVGAPYWEGGTGNNRGAAYIFKRTAGPSWDQQQRFNGSADNDYFGVSVGILGYDWVIVGAHGDNEEATDAGAAFRYSYSSPSWSFYDKLLALDASISDFLGYGVAIDDYCVAGAPGWNYSSTETDYGSTYVYQ